MRAPETIDPGVAAGIKGMQNVLNVNPEYTEESAKSQGVTDYPAYTESQKNILAMDAQAMVEWVREGQSRGWSGRYLKQHVWGAFWRICYLADVPEVDAMFKRVDSAVAVVFPDEVELDFSDRRDYWTKQKHPHPELAAGEEVNGNKLTKDIEKEAAFSRGEVPDVPDSRLVAYRCLQIGRQLAARGKKINEPAWFGALRVLAHCYPDLTREVSAGHEKFNESEFQAKLERIHDENLRPSTCNYFHSHNPGGCCGCTFTTLNSPIALGFENLPKAKRGAQ